MKKILVITIFSLLMVSCAKENEPEFRELNISFKSTEQEFESNIDFGIEIFGNPFTHLTTIHLAGASEAEIIISNFEGGQKKFHLENEFTAIDFSNEKEGVYLLEALIDNVVFRKYLIKQDPK